MSLITLTTFILIAVCNTFYNGEVEQRQIAEKVYLHTDCDHYDGGDDIWFKAYVIDASTNKLSSYTRNLHVELISPASKIIQSRVLKITAGMGNGDFYLTDSLPSGRYRLRAYTNLMRNFNEPFFFSKEIVIINPYDGGNGLNDSIKYIENKIDVSFFPEGGSLVDKISSIVAFKAINALGKGYDITGELFSSSGDLITTFESTHLGMGFFSLKPEPGLNYYAIIKSRDGAEFRAGIPKSFSTGMAIHVFITQDNKLLIRVSTNEKTLPSTIDQEMILTYSSRNLITKTVKIKINSLVNNYIIPVSDLPDGVIRITLSGKEGPPLCERLVYHQKSTNVNVTVYPDKQQYKPREQVKLRISFSGDTIVHDKAFLSLSASETRMTGDSSLFPTSIASWFLLESDIRGPVENPSYYFNTSNDNRLQDLDLLLLTQGWRDFQWKYDFSNLFKHEKGFSLSGRVRRVLSNKSIKGVKINIGIFDTTACSFQSTETDSLGNFRLEGLDITGRARIVASATDKKTNFSKGLIYLDSLLYIPAEVQASSSETFALLPSKYSELKEAAVVKNTIRKKYKLNDTIMLDEVQITVYKSNQNKIENLKKSRARYGHPDHELIMTPGLQTYTDIYQLLEGRIPGLYFDREKGSF